MVALDGDARAWTATPGVSRMVARPGIPIMSRTLRGVVVDGSMGSDWVREAARVVARGSRVLVEDAGADAVSVLESAGLSVMAEEAGTVVAARA